VNAPTIWVLLPVFNGARYLLPLLHSVLSQTHTPLRLLCRDDGSSDESAQLLSACAQAHPDRVILHHEPQGNLGACASFSVLMSEALRQTENTDSPVYFSLADQDDIWLPHKLERLLSRIQALEQSAPPGTPVLVHSDLRVVDQAGDEIAPSFVAYQGLKPERQGLGAQLMLNTLTGCTALINRPLLALSTPVHPGAAMHDGWISLAASAFGQRAFIPEPLMDYRQHAHNTLGAQAWVNKMALSRDAKSPRRFSQRFHQAGSLLALIFSDHRSAFFLANARQAQAFAQQFQHRLKPKDQVALWLSKGLFIQWPPLQRLLFWALQRT
jgi:hypothetical protein